MRSPTGQWLSPVVFLSVLHGTATQTTPDPNSDFFTEPSKFIDFPGCFSDLFEADRNGDGIVTVQEYLGFIQMYAERRKCIENPVLTLQQRTAFNAISCGCRAEEGSSADCCIGSNAHIRTDGALNPQRTATQNGYLTSACRLTDETLGPSQCPPADDVRDGGPLPFTPVVSTPPAARLPSDGGGINKKLLWPLVALAALLLLCCCCGLVLRKKKAKELEEEEMEEIAGRGAPGDFIETDPEQAASVPPPEDPPILIPPVVAAPPIPEEDEEDEDEEEGRKRRGGGPLGEEEEEEGRKRYGAPRLPPPEKEDPGFKLRPIPPPEEEEDPEWDHPGRPIEYPKEKDEIPPDELDRYQPDGGVYIPERPGKDPVEYNPQWERGEPAEPDERDTRKHRIQSGLGEGEVWDELEKDETDEGGVGGGLGDVFDWVVQSALGVLDENDAAAHLATDEPEEEIYM